ncbi:MAG: metallo-mystery pair system four-Cys motif protein [Polyangiaceae bacterium]|nr:metallo-mystery pair system four-Cys motif protein [Polyangiaceae bacterium]
MSTRSLLSFALASLGLLAACGDDTGTGASGAGGSIEGGGGAAEGGGGAAEGGGGAAEGGGGASTMSVELSFRAQVGDAAFDCASSYDGLGTTNATASITDFRLYVHDVRLVDDQDNEVPVALEQDGLWQYEGLALLDFEDDTGSCANGTSETNTVVVGTVPAGAYSGVRFKLGVPAELNHLDPAAETTPSPLNLTALFWAWTSGYKFLRIDSMPQGGAGPFNLHLGSTGCTGDPALGQDVTCTNANVAEVSFEAFDPSLDTLVVDYAAIVADSDLMVDGGGAPGCMSGATDPECAPIFPLLGVDGATGDPLSTQALFRVE